MPFTAQEGVSLASVSDRQFHFRSLSQGGGKGGSLMTFTADKRLLVKQLSNDDHTSLLKCCER